MDKKIPDFIVESGALISCHNVFKSGWSHGAEYIDKERFRNLGATKMYEILTRMVENSVYRGLDLRGYREIGVISPAYGAIVFTLPVAAALEKFFPGVKFFWARTELIIRGGRKIHTIPDKFMDDYYQKAFIILEDVVHNGTTIRETRDLLVRRVQAIVLAALSLADRGGQTAGTLGLEQYFPYSQVKLDQYDLRIKSCPDCQRGTSINTKLGKGSEWVAMFGQPPYPEGMDFSQFWTSNNEEE